MKGDLVIESHQRQGRFGRSRDLSLETLHELVGAHSLTNIVMCHHHRTGITQLFIAARVIRMPVGVDREKYRLLGQSPDGGQYSVRQGCVLIVNQENTVFPDRHSQVSAPAFEHMD